MQSMTGYGFFRWAGKGSQWEATVKSVNSRFLEVRFHIPRELASLEPAMKEMIQKKVQRGSIDVILHRLNGKKESSMPTQLNVAAVKHWALQFKKVKSELKDFNVQINLPDFMQLNGVLNSEADESPSPNEKELLSGYQKALELCLKSRVKEGARLKKELESVLEQLGRCVQTIEKSAKHSVQEYRQKFLNEMESFQGVDIEQKLIGWMDRMEIREEIVRLRSHIQEYSSVLKTQGASGKRLDFYCQELLREINTIGSKSFSIQVTGDVVESKTLIERLREQVQNIE